MTLMESKFLIEICEIYELKTTYGWKFFKEETVRERLISIAYKERYGKYK